MTVARTGRWALVAVWIAALGCSPATGVKDSVPTDLNRPIVKPGIRDIGDKPAGGKSSSTKN